MQSDQEPTLYHLDTHFLKPGYVTIVNVKTIAKNNKRTFEEFRELDKINSKKYKGYEDESINEFSDPESVSEEEEQEEEEEEKYEPEIEYVKEIKVEKDEKKDEHNQKADYQDVEKTEREHGKMKEKEKENLIKKVIYDGDIEVLKEIVADNIVEDGLKWKFTSMMLKKMCDPSIVISQIKKLVTSGDENLNYDIIMSLLNTLHEMRIFKDADYEYLKKFFQNKKYIVEYLDEFLLFELSNTYLTSDRPNALKKFFMSAFLNKTALVKLFYDACKLENQIAFSMSTTSILHKTMLVFLKQQKYIYREYVEMDDRVTVFYLMVSLYRNNIDNISTKLMEIEFYFMIKLASINNQFIERYYNNPLLFGADKESYIRIFQTFIIHLRNVVIPDKLLFETFMVPNEIRQENDVDIRRRKIYDHVKKLSEEQQKQKQEQREKQEETNGD